MFARMQHAITGTGSSLEHADMVMPDTQQLHIMVKGCHVKFRHTACLFLGIDSTGGTSLLLIYLYSSK